MRLRLISTAFAISILPMAANAQLSIDMNSIKCDQYLAMSPSMGHRGCCGTRLCAIYHSPPGGKMLGFSDCKGAIHTGGT